jgi:hypothetical protein
VQLDSRRTRVLHQGCRPFAEPQRPRKYITTYPRCPLSWTMDVRIKFSSPSHFATVHEHISLLTFVVQFLVDLVVKIVLAFGLELQSNFLDQLLTIKR